MGNIKSAICASMMCADIFDMKNTLELLEKAEIEALHIDVMDGAFVPNFQLGTDFIKQLRSYSDIPMDIHLMITEPDKKLGFFDIREGDLVSVHAESTPNACRAIKNIASLGAHPILALNPATPICFAENLLDDIFALLIMTVNPGYSGQVLIPACINKISAARQFLDSRGYENIRIQVDGNVSFDTAPVLRSAGADLFVAGSSSIFRKNMDILSAAALLREKIK